jgi:uracil-DNA glycosylase
MHTETIKMPTTSFDFSAVDASWLPCIKQGLQKMDPTYLKNLRTSPDWLPGPNKIFNAFSLPLHQVKYVLFGESPYPRADSANGYAFWDAAVKELWSPQGLSKKVNRATSLRNIIKMLLVADGKLPPQHTSQEAIAALDKHALVQTNAELFQNFLRHGFLLLNATLVLQDGPPQKDAKAWTPFMQEIINCLLAHSHSIQFLLFGHIANRINKLIEHAPNPTLYAEHPYNISFIQQPDVIAFFKPLHLLRN